MNILITPSFLDVVRKVIIDHFVEDKIAFDEIPQIFEYPDVFFNVSVGVLAASPFGFTREKGIIVPCD